MYSMYLRRWFSRQQELQAGVAGGNFRAQVNELAPVMVFVRVDVEAKDLGQETVDVAWARDILSPKHRGEVVDVVVHR